MCVEFKKKYSEFPQRLIAVQTERKVSIYRKVLCIRSFFDDQKPTVGSPANGKRKEKMKSKQSRLWQCIKNTFWEKNLQAQHLIYLTFKLSIISIYCKPHVCRAWRSCIDLAHISYRKHFNCKEKGSATRSHDSTLSTGKIKRVDTKIPPTPTVGCCWQSECKKKKEKIKCIIQHSRPLFY